MTQAPKITIYLVCHNHRPYIEAAIESVLRQTLEDWELLIFDERSTDGSRDIIAHYRGDERIRVFETDGWGLQRVANTALVEGRGQYIVRLDGDDIFEENLLLVLANHLDRHPEHALVFPDYYLIDEYGNIFSREWRERVYESNHLLDMPPHGACTMIRRATLQEVGGYDEELKAQDGFDLWAKLNGTHRAGNVNLPLFFYRRHSANLTRNEARLAAARREVKRKATLDKLDGVRPITAVIPCRRHYDFIPDLWGLKLGGRSLLHRALECYTRSDIFDQVIVGCDNPEAERVVQEFGDRRFRFVQRSPRSTIRSHSVARGLEEILRAAEIPSSALSVVHFVQAPFVDEHTLEEAVTTLLMTEADNCFCVREVDDLLFHRSAHTLNVVNRPGGMASDFGTYYRKARSLQAFRNANLRFGGLTGARQVSFLVSAEESFYIDSEMQLSMAEVLDQSRTEAKAEASAR